jgi:AcrR family transcriptional regulator
MTAETEPSAPARPAASGGRTGEPGEAAGGEALALLDAGLALMVAARGRRPRVADIVAAAGLSNDAFYRFFASKDALVEAIVERGARTVVGYVRYRMARAAEDGPEARLRAGIEAVPRQAPDENPALQEEAPGAPRPSIWSASSPQACEPRRPSLVGAMAMRENAILLVSESYSDGGWVRHVGLQYRCRVPGEAGLGRGVRP